MEIGVKVQGTELRGQRVESQKKNLLDPAKRNWLLNLEPIINRFLAIALQFA